MSSHRPTLFGRLFPFIVILASILWIATSNPLRAQSTVATGNIQGTVSDPTGAVVASAKITITNTDTGQAFHLTSSSAGTYNSGSLVPGNYSVHELEAAAQSQYHLRCALRPRHRQVGQRSSRLHR